VSVIGDSVAGGLEGVYNAGARDSIDKLAFGRQVADGLVAGGGGLVRPRPAGDDDGRAPRPLDLRLDVSKLEGALGRPQPTILEGLAVLAGELSLDPGTVG
jgi:dTDP-4-dehydrorhamnose reductase